MGSDRDAYYKDVDQSPAHNVFLDTYYVDKYEVSNSLYKICVYAGNCTRPHNIRPSNHPQYYGISEFDNYPVIYVDWYQAEAYCKWRDARLPTEAEWEKAARGTDERYYPWGDSAVSRLYLANYTPSSVYTGDTTEVNSYPLGKSVYGSYNMAGNVWEWVNDWYRSEYYSTLGDNAVNPQGPSESDSKVLRGGAWTPGSVQKEGSISTFNRFRDFPLRFYNDTGFRCTLDANQ